MWALGSPRITAQRFRLTRIRSRVFSASYRGRLKREQAENCYVAQHCVTGGSELRNERVCFVFLHNILIKREIDDRKKKLTEIADEKLNRDELEKASFVSDLVQFQIE